MASACDSCFLPGHCCRGLWLNIAFRPEVVRLDVLAYMAEHGYPFIPTEENRAVDESVMDPKWRGSAGFLNWKFDCANLTADGRCGDYENRPDACRTYQPGEDGLCAHHGGAEAGAL